MAILSLGAGARDSLSISLLTCSQGRDISSAFGHSALRVKDLRNGRDMVFNYGTFSFQEPHFMLNFLRGDLNYFLSVTSFQQFKRSYDATGRGISEQTLSLTPLQAAELYSFLTDNYKPSNRYYLYDFLQDNCATRIRDIFDRSKDFSIKDTLTGTTYRDELTRLVGDRRKDILSKASSPFTVFTLLFVLYLVFYLRSGNKWKFMSICSTVLYIILGLGGVIICLMWFATNHVWTADNWNLLWMNPLFLIPVCMPSCWAKNMIIDLLAAVAGIGLICSWLLPQTFHPATAVIILLTVLMALSRRAIYRKY